MPASTGLRPKPTWNSSGNRNGVALMATRKMGAGRQCRDGEGLHLESREVEQRIFCARQMPHGQPADQGAGGKQRHGRHGAVFRMGDPLEAVEH